METELQATYHRLQEVIRSLGSALIAFSGGVDSSLLLKVSQETLPGRILAVTAKSATTPSHELAEATNMAQELGIRHLIIDSDELTLPEFSNNPPDRCYICKKQRFTALTALAREHDMAFLADGSNLDDQQDYRPGMRALKELAVRSPLTEAGLTKSEVRRLSRALGLGTWDKPPYACLATRIPYGSTITPEKLRQVDLAEDFIRGLGLSRQVRVRHYGDTARLEVAPRDLANFLQEEARRQVTAFLKELGFRFVTLDLEGYRMGSLNQAII
jgi:uncharacterized protein